MRVTPFHSHPQSSPRPPPACRPAPGDQMSLFSRSSVSEQWAGCHVCGPSQGPGRPVQALLDEGNGVGPTGLWWEGWVPRWGEGRRLGQVLLSQFPQSPPCLSRRLEPSSQQSCVLERHWCIKKKKKKNPGKTRCSASHCCNCIIFCVLLVSTRALSPSSTQRWLRWFSNWLSSLRLAFKFILHGPTTEGWVCIYVCV